MYTARPALGGVLIVAVNAPVRTQVWPVFGTPSLPVNGRRSHRSCSEALVISSNAFLAPMAMASFCAPIKSIGVLLNVFKRNQDVTQRCALSSVHCTRSVVIWMLGGIVSYIPAKRAFATPLSGLQHLGALSNGIVIGKDDLYVDTNWAAACCAAAACSS